MDWRCAVTSKPVVVRSINLEGETRCVDIFRRSVGTYGFEEYRRDPEDRRGWFAIGCHASLEFATAEQSLTAAREHVPWLASVLDDG
jgi:hypothetical protein